MSGWPGGEEGARGSGRIARRSRDESPTRGPGARPRSDRRGGRGLVHPQLAVHLDDEIGEGSAGVAGEPHSVPHWGCVLSGRLSARRRRCPIHPLVRSSTRVSMRSACHLLGDNECRHPAAGPARPAHDGGAESDLRRRSAAACCAAPVCWPRRRAGRSGLAGRTVLLDRPLRRPDRLATATASRSRSTCPTASRTSASRPCARSPGGPATRSVTAPRRRWC